MGLETKIIAKILEINAKLPPSLTYGRISGPQRLNDLLKVTKY